MIFSKIIFINTSLLVILTNLILVSCSDDMVSQCTKIILITQAIAKESKTNRQTEDLQKTLHMADSFDKAADKMRNLSISDDDLVKYKSEFADIYQGYARTTRQFISALQEKDINTIKLMQHQLQQLGKKEQKMGNRMNNYCKAK